MRVDSGSRVRRLVIMKEMKRKLFWIVLGTLLYAFLEISSLCVLYLVKKTKRVVYSPINSTLFSEKEKERIGQLVKGETKYYEYSSTLGWALKKNVSSRVYETNSRGIRADREYSLIPPYGTVRISTFGDSFTHCDGVRNKDTWQEKINHAHPDLEAINFGVCAFGLDQSFLYYQKEGTRYQSHIVFIGFMSENICRNVNVFRPFYGPYGPSMTKPRFTLINDKLILNKNPIKTLSQYQDLLNFPGDLKPELSTNDYYFQTRYTSGFFDFLPSVRLAKIISSQIWRYKKGAIYHKNGLYNEDSEAYRVTVKIFDAFHESIEQHHSIPVIILFPHKGDVAQYRKRERVSYEPLLNYFQLKNYRYIDIVTLFDSSSSKLRMKDMFGPKNHYTPLTNELIAKHMTAYLQKERLADLDINDHGSTQDTPIPNI